MEEASEDFDNLCPLCMEEMDLTDRHLRPCQCGYQICVWCWHQIMELASKDNSEGRCPACRTPYDKDKVVGTRLNTEELLDMTVDKRKSHKSKNKTQEGRKHLCNVRVLQRNLVYIVGFPLSLADEETLERREYFGQYGKILKVAVSRQLTHANPSASVYVTFVREEDALKCIKAVDGCLIEGKLLRACFGTNKYCHAWLRYQTCNNPDCLYLHDEGLDEDSYTKEEMLAKYGSKNQYFQELTKPPHRVAGPGLPPPVPDGSQASKVVVSKAPAPAVNPVKTLPSAASWGRAPGKQPGVKVQSPSIPKKKPSNPSAPSSSGSKSVYEDDDSTLERGEENILKAEVQACRTGSFSQGSSSPEAHDFSSAGQACQAGFSQESSSSEAHDYPSAVGVPSSSVVDSAEQGESNIISDILNMDLRAEDVNPEELTRMLSARSGDPKPYDESPLSWKGSGGKQQSRFSFARQENASSSYASPAFDERAGHVSFNDSMQEFGLMDTTRRHMLQSPSSIDYSAQVPASKSRLFAPPGFSGSAPPPGFSARNVSNRPQSPAGRLNGFELIDPAIMAVGRGAIQNELPTRLRTPTKPESRQLFSSNNVDDMLGLMTHQQQHEMLDFDAILKQQQQQQQRLMNERKYALKYDPLSALVHGDPGRMPGQYDDTPYSPGSSSRGFRGVPPLETSWLGYEAFGQEVPKFKSSIRGGGHGVAGLSSPLRQAEKSMLFSNGNQQSLEHYLNEQRPPSLDHYLNEQSFREADIQGAFV